MLALLLPACTYRIEDVFDKSSSERISEAIAKTGEVLKGASDGWIMEYYADERYGGYNVICKFNQDNTVTVQSEIYGTQTSSSHYKIDQSQGVVLSFDEYNEVFHFFSNPANPAGVGSNGTGMGGDFEFRVISAEPDEVIIKGKKHGSMISMKPLAAGTDWTGYLEQALEMEDLMSTSGYNLHFGETVISATASYRRITFNDPETGAAKYIPFIYTPEGMRFYKEFEFAGKKVSELKYSAADGFCYAVGDASVYIEPKDIPLSELITSGMWFFKKDAMSSLALADFLKCKAGSDSEGEDIVFMHLGNGLTDALANSWGIGFLSGDYYGMLFYSTQAVDDNTITFTYTGADSSNGAWYVQYAGYSVLTTSFPGTYKLSSDNLRNPSYIRMEKTNNSAYWIELQADEIMYPFE